MAEQKKLDILTHIRPIHVISTIGLFMLGAGLARYLGERINIPALFFGMVWLIFLQQGFFFLGDYFQTPFHKGLYSQTPFDSPRDIPIQDKKDEVLLYLSVVAFSTAAVITVLLGLQDWINLTAISLMAICFLGFILLVVPGLSLDNSGVGEIITSICLLLCPPALGFTLQYGEFHPFLVYGILPQFPLHLAMIILLRLISYRDDLRLNRKTLLIRIGWVRAVFLHNMLVLGGFLLFGISLLFGFPIRLVGFVFLSLPAAFYLIWYLSKLEYGAPVRWPLITLFSLTVYFLPLYLICFSSWVN
jgi:1,4-dihydroxy-2-naphthoate octaprenyltransferase